VYPADILPNVRAVAPVADDIELVLFESAEGDNLPSPAHIRELRTLADEHALTYTVHFPIDRALGSESPAEREALLDQMLRIVDLANPLNPFAWLVHVQGIDAHAPPARVARWQADALPLLKRLHRHIADPARVCVENLDYPFEWCLPFIEPLGFSVCLDAGHLWLGDYDWRGHVREHLARTQVIHLYGIGEGPRHLSLEVAPERLVDDFLASVAGFSGVLTLETFGYEDTHSSLERLSTCLARIH